MKGFHVQEFSHHLLCAGEVRQMPQRNGLHDHVAQGCALGGAGNDFHAASVGGELVEQPIAATAAENEVEERGLPRAIGPHEAQPIATVHLQRSFAEQRAPAK